MTRCLTKSRFKLALECPAKLFYTGKPEYANQSLDDSFLLALAEGGFQVGELAKRSFPGGYEIDTLDTEQALARTHEHLRKEQVTLYEAAFAVDNLFIRADILVKKGERLDLYEVKAKSFDSYGSSPFLGKQGGITSSWRPYLYDVAFQKYVVCRALPQYTVRAHLTMADKSALCPRDGLNQKFRVVRGQDGRKSVVTDPGLSDADLFPSILCHVNVDDLCNKIYAQADKEMTFEAMVEFYARHYASDIKISVPVSTACAGCEFQATPEEEAAGLKNGKKECWRDSLGWKAKDFETETVLNIWNFRRKSDLLKASKVRMTDLVEEDVAPHPDGKPGLSPSERQWMQVEKHRNGDRSAWIDRENLRREMAGWRFPLHFIDFETTMVAIPFNAGRRPYEGIAFQFSHHAVHRDGTVVHCGEYLNTERGIFPNYAFLRRLREELDRDSGTIFRYSNHENTFLNLIHNQLLADASIPDREELCAFIRSITHSVKNAVKPWEGERDMVDLWELVKRYYYDPATGGSNSIKQVLPAILNRSRFLQEKYSRPIYGAAGGIRSLNFKDWCWVEMENGIVLDPYRRLPRMFRDASDKDLRLLSDDDELRDGGAALTAYARMQFEEMGDYERGEIRSALLKYCELDTLAMVMLYEGMEGFAGRGGVTQSSWQCGC